MSLDVYLTLPAPIPRPATSGIFVRENGQTKEITEAEWSKRFPDREPMKLTGQAEETTEVYSANITHNLGEMAREAGLYQCLWRPNESGLTKAAQLIPLLEAGLLALAHNPEKYRAMNPPSGWGSYEGLMGFVAGYLAACCANPEAKVRVWR